MENKKQKPVKEKKPRNNKPFIIAACLLVAAGLIGGGIYAALKFNWLDIFKAEKGPSFPVMVGGLTFDEPVTTVVSLSPLVTEALFTMPYSAHVVGVTDYCDRRGFDIQNMGTTLIPKIDRIIAAAPQLVIVQTPLSDADRITLEQAGIKVVTLTAPTSIEEVRAFYGSIASLFSGQTMGNKRANAIFDRYLDELDLYNRSLPPKEERYTFALLPNLTGASATPDTVEYMLMRNIFSGNAIGGEFWDTKIEKIAEGNPGVLVISDKVTLEQVAATPLVNTDAYKNGRVFFINYAQFERYSPRAIFEIANIATKLYPNITPAGPKPEVEEGAESAAQGDEPAEGESKAE